MLLSFVAVFALILTSSRLAMLSSLVMLILQQSKQSQNISAKFFGCAVGLLGSISFVYFLRQDESMVSRFFWWRSAIESFVLNPWFGSTSKQDLVFTFTNFNRANLKSIYAHSFVLQHLSESVLIRTGFLFCYLILILKKYKTVTGLVLL